MTECDRVLLIVAVGGLCQVATAIVAFWRPLLVLVG